jgi:hypothetical protein
VIAHRGCTAYRLNTHGNRIAHIEGRRNANRMHGECANWTLRIADLSEEFPVRVKDLARIAYLPTSLGVERGLNNN